MALTNAEKEACRYHLGYAGVTDAGSMTLGVPASRQTNFILEGAMTRLMPESEPRVRELLAELAKIEAELKCARGELHAARAGGVELRSLARGERITDALEAEHDRWAGRLGDVLGVPRYPYSSRDRAGGGHVRSIPLRRPL